MDHVAHLLRIASTIACGIVLVAFAVWAMDETKAASGQQAAQIDAASNGATTPPQQQPAVPVAPPAEPEHDGLRGAIDDANAKLIAPFDDVVDSTNAWVQHGVPALFALLAYGLLGRLLIGYLPAHRA
jgi:hypothetical protein